MRAAKAVGWVVLAVLTVFVALWAFQTYQRANQRDRDEQKRAEQAAADSVAAATALADRAQLTADSTVVVYVDRWRTLKQIDTLRIPVEAREALRSCAAAVTALQSSCERKDAVIAALRTEVETLERRPRERHGRWSAYLDAGGTITKDGYFATGRVGSALHLIGPIGAVAEVEPLAPLPMGKREGRASAFLRYTFR